MDRKPKRITPWTAVVLLLGYVALATPEMPPLEPHYQAARAALAKDDLAKAGRELKLALQHNPLNGEAHFLLASLLARDGNLDQAAAGYQETVRLAPNNAVARYNLGTIMLVRGEPVLAARQFESALGVRPDHVPTYNNLAKAYFLTGLPELALASYNSALRLDPANAIAQKGLAVLTAAAGAPSQPGGGTTRYRNRRSRTPLRRRRAEKKSHRSRLPFRPYLARNAPPMNQPKSRRSGN